MNIDAVKHIGSKAVAAQAYAGYLRIAFEENGRRVTEAAGVDGSVCGNHGFNSITVDHFAAIDAAETIVSDGGIGGVGFQPQGVNPIAVDS